MAAPFQLVAGHVALDFVNTLDNRYDPERRIDLLPSYARFIAFVRQSGILTAPQARRLVRAAPPAAARAAHHRAIELRETLHSLFRAVREGRRPHRESLNTLNRVLAEAALARGIDCGNGHFRWAGPDPAATPSAPLLILASAAADLLTSADLASLRECGAPACRWLFLDHSKNHSRRWCDMKVCGNRAKAQRFHARQREVAG
ncbi:MAG TPA: ABATE domain-containing protein [Bryobacteraceae bacterium]|nr:ABATE domain-containing protein [Bryobacteraceae bacterium]